MRILLVQLLALQTIFALAPAASAGVTYISDDIRDGTVSFEAGKAKACSPVRVLSGPPVPSPNKQASSQLKPSSRPSLTMDRPAVACAAEASARTDLGTLRTLRDLA